MKMKCDERGVGKAYNFPILLKNADKVAKKAKKGGRRGMKTIFYNKKYEKMK
jgi:hypothetical protein